MPSFFPEGDAPLPNDREPRSLQKINSLLQSIESKTGATTITGPVTVSSEVEIKNDSGNPVPIKEGFSIPEYDRVNLTYDNDGKVSGIAYLKNNVGLANLTLGYDNDGNLTSVTKS